MWKYYGDNKFIFIVEVYFCNPFFSIGSQCFSIDINTHNKKCLKKVLLSFKVDEIPKNPSFQPCGMHKLKNQRKNFSQYFSVVRRL
jgi:hypothetical protein